MFINETWLNSNVDDALLSVPNYTLIRRDRTSKRGGGLLVLHKSHYVVQEVRSFDAASSFEYICVDYKSAVSGTVVRFLCIYLAPDLAQKRENIKLLCDCIQFYKNERSLFYVFGDFNLPMINWNNLSTPSNCANIFLDYCISEGLEQLILETTTTNDSTIDLFLCNDIASRILSGVKVLPPLTSTCDHSVIEFHMTVQCAKKNEQANSSYSYESGDYDSINYHLSKIDWLNIFNELNNDIQKIYDRFLEIIHGLIKQYVPVKVCNNTIKFPRVIKDLARRKRNLYRKSKKDKTFCKMYKDVSKEYDRKIDWWFEEKEKKIINSKKDSYFYSYANKKLKSRPSIPPLIDKNGLLVEDDVEKADLFNVEFYSKFIKDNGQSLQLQDRISQTNFIDLIKIDQRTIINAIKKIPAKSSFTPDGLPGIVVKKVGPTISFFLMLFFNISLSTSQVPHQWKEGYITPVYKKSSRNSASNYRPISLTSTLSRLLEKIICNILISHLSSHNLISSSQHGFLPHRSSSTQLLGALQDWINGYNNEKQTSAVYTDISKAFDTVSHPKLLEVIKSYGIGQQLYKWIESFITNRKQFVRINESFSNPMPVLSGIPQGSVIGPLLFLLYMDDVTKVVSKLTTVSLFADDAKFYSHDSEDLQASLNNVCLFFETRQLTLAKEKCEHIFFGKIKETVDFSLSGQTISQTSLIKDLGVFISSDLKWESHTNHLKLRASQRCYLILRSFSSKNVWTLLQTFKTFVRPILEYGSVIWSSNCSKDIRSIEGVQRYFTRKIFRRCGIPYSSYADRLHKLNLKTLEYRRKEFDIIMVYKIVHNLVDVPFCKYFKFYSTPYSTRRHKYCLERVKCGSNHEQSFFSNRTIPAWNELPHRIVECETLESFTRSLKQFDLATICKFLRFD